MRQAGGSGTDAAVRSWVGVEQLEESSAAHVLLLFHS